MKFEIEIFHPQLTRCKLYRGDDLIWEQDCQGRHVFSHRASPDAISLWFEPWRIKPEVRVDGILVDYALAQINQFDHKLDITLDQDFYHSYHEQDIRFRQQSIFQDGEPDPYIYDAVIGVGQMHQDIVDQLREKINAK
jgi:hypothetical protein